MFPFTPHTTLRLDTVQAVPLSKIQLNPAKFSPKFSCIAVSRIAASRRLNWKPVKLEKISKLTDENMSVCLEALVETGHFRYCMTLTLHIS
jgi:hypothetical protein